MKLANILLVTGLTLGITAAAMAAPSRRTAAAGPSGMIRVIQLAAEQPDEDFRTFEVYGSLTAGAEAILVPTVWDGRARFVLTDAIVHVGAKRQGWFGAMIVLPKHYRLLQVELVFGVERIESPVCTAAPDRASRPRQLERQIRDLAEARPARGLAADRPGSSPAEASRLTAQPGGLQGRLPVGALDPTAGQGKAGR